MVIAVGLIGPGLVGREVLHQLSQYSSAKPNLLGFAPVELRLLGVCRSRQALISRSIDKSIPLDQLVSVDPTTNKHVEMISSISNPDIDNVIEIFVEKLCWMISNSRNLVIIDCTASELVAGMYPRWLAQGVSIVTPNKKAFSSSLNLWNDIQRLTSLDRGDGDRALCYHESSVGAGLPVISTIKDLLITGDRIIKIEGILSGTLSFLFNQFCSAECRIKFSDIVSTARQLGYTEPDPRDDLNGVDVARKVLTLARLIGMPVDSIDELQVDNIVPVGLRSVATAQEFMSRLSEYDNEFDQMKNEALANGEVLRYVGVVDPLEGKCTVKIGRYPQSHPFAQLKGTDNIISIQTDRFKSPMIIQGAGAGAAVTAHGVLSDLIKVATILDWRR